MALDFGGVVPALHLTVDMGAVQGASPKPTLLISGREGVVGTLPVPTTSFTSSFLTYVMGTMPVPTLNALMGVSGPTLTAPMATIRVTEAYRVPLDVPAPTLAISGNFGASIKVPVPKLSITEAATFAGNVPIPTLAIVGNVNAALTAPAPTISVVGYAGRTVSAAMTAPAPTLNIVRAHDVRLTLPAPTLSIKANTFIAVSVPAPTLNVVSGQFVSIEAPSPTIVMASYTGMASNVAVALPRPTLAATLTPGNAGALSVTAPKPTLSATAYIGTSGTVAGTVPAIRCSATAVSGSYEAISISVPLLTISGSMLIGTRLDFAASVPPITLNVQLSGDIANGVTVYAMNMKHFGVSLWDDFAADSIAVFNGKLVKFDSSGIWELSGTQDNAVDIDMRLKTGLSDMNDPMTKRIPEIALVLKGNEKTRVRVSTDHGDEYEYAVEPFPRGGVHQTRVKPGKGLKSSMYAIEVRNYRGDPLELHSIKPMPMATRRKVG